MISSLGLPNRVTKSSILSLTDTRFNFLASITRLIAWICPLISSDVLSLFKLKDSIKGLRLPSLVV